MPQTVPAWRGCRAEASRPAHPGWGEVGLHAHRSSSCWHCLGVHVGIVSPCCCHSCRKCNVPKQHGCTILKHWRSRFQVFSHWDESRCGQDGGSRRVRFLASCSFSRPHWFLACGPLNLHYSGLTLSLLLLKTRGCLELMLTRTLSCLGVPCLSASFLLHSSLPLLCEVPEARVSR